jgi:hypothetical protein
MGIRLTEMISKPFGTEVAEHGEDAGGRGADVRATGQNDLMRHLSDSSGVDRRPSYLASETSGFAPPPHGGYAFFSRWIDDDGGSIQGEAPRAKGSGQVF